MSTGPDQNSIQQPRTRRTVALLVATAGVGLAAGIADHAWSQQGITNSKHDFSLSNNGPGNIWGSDDIDEICVFCHTPHQAMSTVVLWNRALPANNIFSIYDNETLSGPQPGFVRQASLRCLSCHDGSVAIDAFGGRVGTMPAIGDIYYPGGPYGIGMNIGGNFSGAPSANDLTDDHPISIAYNDVRINADRHLQAQALVTLPLFGRDPANRTVECSSCHEVHREFTFPYLLRMDNAGSLLCRHCHLK